MAKIIPFRLPALDASGDVGFEVPVKRDVPTSYHQPKKEPIVLSVMPEQSFPIGHEDLRPLLQRDGLILMSWGIFQDREGKEPHRYLVHWVTSQGKHYHYASDRVVKDMLSEALPQRMGDRYFYRGIHSRWDTWVRCYHADEVADYEYLVAPFDLCKKTIPGFILVLKRFGSTVDFDCVFSLAKSREISSPACQYLENHALEQA